LVNGGLGIVAFEDGIAGNKDIGTGLEKEVGVLEVDTAIDLNEAVGVLAIAEFSELTHLVVGILDELLSAEAWIDAHEEHEVALLDDILEQADGRRGVEDHSPLHAGVVDGVKNAVEVCAGFIMDGEDIGASLLEIVHIAAGVHNHQVYVEGFLGVFFDVLDDGLTERDVGDKESIHHIDMQPVALGGVEHLDVALKIAEVGT
jgi:hypothetical protein